MAEQSLQVNNGVLPQERVGFTPVEVARFLGVSHDWVLARCREGVIRARRFSRLWIISRSEVLRIVGENLPQGEVLTAAVA